MVDRRDESPSGEADYSREDRGEPFYEPSKPPAHTPEAVKSHLASHVAALTGAFVAAVEAEVVPRLLPVTKMGPGPSVELPAELVSEVATAAVRGDMEAICLEVSSAIEKGLSVGDVLLRLVTPAAKLLGTDWEEDRRDFMDVTMGLGTLHSVITEFTADEFDVAPTDRTILLGPTPGEMHTLGLAVVRHFFAQARWNVDYQPYADRVALVGAVQDEWYGVVGLSLSGETLISEARDTISAVRSASMNPDVKILMGGPAFTHQGDLVERLGANAVCIDARDAVKIANGWADTGNARSAPR